MKKKQQHKEIVSLLAIPCGESQLKWLWKLISFKFYLNCVSLKRRWDLWESGLLQIIAARWLIRLSPPKCQRCTFHEKKEIPYWWSPTLRMGDHLSIQKKQKNHTNSTHSKIKFYIVFINFFFMMDIKIFTNKGEPGSGGIIH